MNSVLRALKMLLNLSRAWFLNYGYVGTDYRQQGITNASAGDGEQLVQKVEESLLVAGFDASATSQVRELLLRALPHGTAPTAAQHRTGGGSKSPRKADRAARHSR